MNSKRSRGAQREPPGSASKGGSAGYGTIHALADEAGPDDLALNDALLGFTPRVQTDSVRQRAKEGQAKRNEWQHTAMLFVAATVGVGELELPGNLATLGWVGGLGAFGIVMLLNQYAGMLLWRTKQYLVGRPVVAYADVGRELWGEGEEKWCLGLMWVNWLLGLGDYLLVLQSTLQAVFYDVDLCQPAWGVIVATMLVPLTQARSLHRIRSLSFLHIGCLFVVMVLVLFSLIYEDDHPTTRSHLKPGERPPTRRYPERGFVGWVKGLSAMCGFIFAMGEESMYLEMMGEMREVRDFPKALWVGNFIVTAICVLIACTAYWFKGNSVPGYIMDVLPYNAMRRIANGFLFVQIVITYVIRSQVLSRALHLFISPHRANEGTWGAQLEWAGISCTLLSVSYVIANAIPFFSTLSNIIGAISNVPIDFLLPAVFFLQAARIINFAIPMWEVALLKVLIGFSVLVSFFGMVGSIYMLVDDWGTYGGPFACHCRSRDGSCTSRNTA